LTIVLQQHGYTQSKNDYSLFLRTSGSHLTIVVVYVDDILFTGSHLEHILLLKQHLHSTIGIKDLGLLHYFLGFEVTYVSNGISLSQRKFTIDLLKDIGFLHSKPATTSLPLHCKLSPEEGDLLQDPSFLQSNCWQA